MRIAIIGAGVSGLSALRHCLDASHDCVVFEQTKDVGGTWVYTEETGINSHGLPIHSSMYIGLKTNIAKELMTFDDFPYTEPDHSFITQPEVLKYINGFAEKFNLLPYIKFLTIVMEVLPLPKERWLLKAKNLETNEENQEEFDAVIVAVGNYSKPNIPKFPGVEKFRGTIIHSHSYRVPDPFQKRKVLIIGGGPSGADIASILHGKAETVILSHRSGIYYNSLLKVATIKPNVLEFRENSVKFVDNSEETIDDVIFCTGYQYSYPFLTKECGIEVENNWIKYVYKHCINVKHPTMAFISIPYRTVPFIVAGIQTRFFLALLERRFSVTEDEMMADIMKDVEERKEKGFPVHYYHKLGLEHEKYMNEIADIAKIKRIQPVIFRMYEYHHLTVAEGNRTYVYKINNDEEFTVTKS